jgi:hypothetical protein
LPIEILDAHELGSQLTQDYILPGLESDGIIGIGDCIFLRFTENASPAIATYRAKIGIIEVQGRKKKAADFKELPKICGLFYFKLCGSGA